MNYLIIIVVSALASLPVHAQSKADSGGEDGAGSIQVEDCFGACHRNEKRATATDPSPESQRRTGDGYATAVFDGNNGPGGSPSSTK